MGGADVDVARAELLQLAHGAAQGAGGVDHVVVDDAGAALDVADDAHDLGLVVAGTALVGDGDVAAEHVGQALGGLGTAHVGRHDHGVVHVEALGGVVLGEEGHGGEVVHRDVEVALDLALVQVNRDDAVDAGGLVQVGHEACRDGLAGGRLAVLAGVGVVGEHGGDGTGRGALGGVGGDEDLHEHVVEVGAGDRLDDEHVAAANALGEARVDLAVGELLNLQVAQLGAQLGRHRLGELPVRRAREDLHAFLD